jgi:spore coat polysaccharide biosynthesis protein SpsF
MKTALILQARLDSSRLPGKSLLPLGGEPLILRVMEALKRVPCDLHILACPEDCEQDFKSLAAQAGFELSTGSKEDVLSRFCTALRRFFPDFPENKNFPESRNSPESDIRVIRATGDNPFVFADAAAAIHGEALSLDADYAGYSGLPLGAGVEAVSARALFTAETEAREVDEREHVCPFLYRHPEHFSLHRPLAPKKWQGRDMRLTVDTPEDYERAKLLYDSLNTTERYSGTTIIETYKNCFGSPGADT